MHLDTWNDQYISSKSVADYSSLTLHYHVVTPRKWPILFTSNGQYQYFFQSVIWTWYYLQTDNRPGSSLDKDTKRRTKMSTMWATTSWMDLVLFESGAILQIISIQTSPAANYWGISGVITQVISGLITIHQTLFVAWAFHFAEPNSSGASRQISNRASTLVTEHSAKHVPVLQIPLVITNRSPRSVGEQFDSSIILSSIRKSNRTCLYHCKFSTTMMFRPIPGGLNTVHDAGLVADLDN